MNDRIPDDKPTRVPARASQWWNSPSAIDLARTEGLTAIRGDRAKSALLLAREPTDRKAGCGKSARPVWREGERTTALPTPIPDHPFVSYPVATAGWHVDADQCGARRNVPL
jgi:hypothetical protein